MKSITHYPGILHREHSTYLGKARKLNIPNYHIWYIPRSGCMVYAVPNCLKVIIDLVVYSFVFVQIMFRVPYNGCASTIISNISKMNTMRRHFKQKFMLFADSICINIPPSSINVTKYDNKWKWNLFGFTYLTAAGW